ncbi:MAG TPA: sigma 54-interacting transcriptional regulator [Alcanivoracaceae bacterium]|nr:sigma 54-interacting transcriptional regulator [Alcanivoracaceae bacterium]
MTTINTAAHSIMGSFLTGSPYGAYAFRHLIVSAHHRSESYGLRPDEKCSVEFVATPKQLQEENETLLQAAKPIMEYMAAQLKLQQSDALLILANAEATIVAVTGGTSFTASTELRDVKPGINWSENIKGTNALGTALEANRVVLVNEGEHFLTRLQQFSCASVVLKNSNDEALGVLCITRPGALSPVRDEISLLKFAASRIVNRHFLAENKQHYVFTLHRSPDFLDTPDQGLLALSKEGVVKAIDEQALKQIGLPKALVLGVSLDGFLHKLSGFMRSADQRVGDITIQGQQLYYEVLHWPAHLSILGPYTTVNKTTSKPADLTQRDAARDMAVQRLKQGFSQEIPVLLYGEPGTGKERLAKEIHHSILGYRAPFITVNCGSITQSALERELIGSGTPANKGAIGQARHGTLFLSSAEHLPHSLQSKLLSILSANSYVGEPVNVRLIVAASEEPQSLYTQQQWTPEFYTETTMFSMGLPPLRERTDIIELCNYYLKEFDQSEVEISDEVKTLFKEGYWPGNVRQLKQVLRALFATSAQRIETLHIKHLPEEVVQQLQTGPQEQAAGLDLRRNEIALMREALARNGGNMSAAARELGVSRATLYRRLKQ